VKHMVLDVEVHSQCPFPVSSLITYVSSDFVKCMEFVAL